MTTLAVISDIHGNIFALREVVADIERRRISSVVNLGDHLSGPLWPKETAAFLFRQHWVQIAGNHDRTMAFQDPATLGASDAFALDGLDPAEHIWLKQLPSTTRLHDEILIFHGTPASDSEYLLESVDHGRGRLATREEIKHRLSGASAPVMLCGHTHIQRVVESDDGNLIVNPGSVGLPAFDDELPEPHVMESGSPHARYAILEGGGKTWTASLISVPYDSHGAAEQARTNGRAEWARALETGFMS